VLSGKVSNGEFAFLTGDSLSVMIDGSQTPVLLSFADGFNDYGAVDYVQTVTRKQSAWSLPANSTSYLYVERSASGGLTYGSTTLEPLRQPNAPEAATDKMYYNTTSEKMNVYTGTYWKSILRVVVAIAVTDATRVKSIKYYDPTINTATDAVIGKRTVDGKDYLITDILNQMAEAIKKIAGDENFTNNPTRTLKAITDTINGLGETYYKKTDTVNEAKHATNADEAKHAASADTASIATQNVKKSGDTMTGNLTIKALESEEVDFDGIANGNTGYSGFTFGKANNYNVFGKANWGMGIAMPWHVSEKHGVQMYFTNSGSFYIRYADGNEKGYQPWERVATFDANNNLVFPNGTKLRIV
ncbi:MAG: hypothetical protein E6165_06995, partial [Varibaculum cambriense]|nr:hypothetical protein [Varibaculum cambriense]